MIVSGHEATEVLLQVERDIVLVEAFAAAVITSLEINTGDILVFVQTPLVTEVVPIEAPFL